MKDLFLKLYGIHGYVYLDEYRRDFFNQYLELNLKDRNTCFRIMEEGKE